MSARSVNPSFWRVSMEVHVSRATLAIVFGVMIMTATGANAQTNSSTSGTTTEEVDPIVEALEREKKIAELKKAIAEAEKAELAAKLPTTEGSGVTGSVTFGEGSGYFAEMLAYQAMIQAAGRVADGLPNPASSPEQILVVTGDDLAKTAQLWEIANARVEDANGRIGALIDRYKEDYDFAAPEMAAAAFTTAAAVLGAAADIVSFFRSDLTVTARTVSIPPSALIAATSAKLRAKGWRPVLPGSSLTKTTLFGKIEALLASRRQLAERRRVLEDKLQPDLTKLATKNLELEHAKADLTKATAAQPADAAAMAAAETKVRGLQQSVLPLATKKGRWEKVAAEIDATLAATDALVKALLEGGEGRPSAVEAVAAADAVKSKSTVKILRLEASSQGGEMHVSKSPWRTRLTYVGGVAVTYLLLDHYGAVLASGVIAQPIAKSVKAKDAATGLTIGGRGSAATLTSQ